MNNNNNNNTKIKLALGLTAVIGAGYLATQIPSTIEQRAFELTDQLAFSSEDYGVASYSAKTGVEGVNSCYTGIDIRTMQLQDVPQESVEILVELFCDAMQEGDIGHYTRTEVFALNAAEIDAAAHEQISARNGVPRKLVDPARKLVVAAWEKYREN